MKTIHSNLIYSIDTEIINYIHIYTNRNQTDLIKSESNTSNQNKLHNCNKSKTFLKIANSF